jgi:hypothetical protein
MKAGGAVRARAAALRLAGRGLRASRSRVVRWAFGLGAAGLAIWAVAAEWAAVRAAADRLSLAAVTLALAATVANVLAAGMVWRTALADLGSRIPLPVAARIFFVGQLGKYLPGSVWPLVMQTELGRDHGVPRRRTGTATIVTMMIGLLSAVVLALACAPLAPDGLPRGLAWMALLALPVGLTLHPAVLGRAVDRGLAVLGREPLERRTSLGGTARATGWALVSWAFAGVQVWVLVGALGAPMTVRTLALATGGYALAWTAGFVVVVTPAGAGVREVALGAALIGVLDRGEVVVVVLISRVLYTAVDLAVAAVGVAAARRSVAAPPHRPA